MHAGLPHYTKCAVMNPMRYVQLPAAKLACQMRATVVSRSHSHAITSSPARRYIRSNLNLKCQASGDAAGTANPTSASSSTPYSYILPRQAVAVFASAAALGPFCDGLHSQHDVLHYEQPSVQLQVDLGSLHWSFETCWWVPLLFGAAGVIIGVSVPLLDSLLAQHQKEQQRMVLGRDTTRGNHCQDRRMSVPQQEQQHAAGLQHAPSWGAVLLCISFFVVQYGLSGILEQPALGQTIGDTPVPSLDALLAAYAMAHWYAFDRTPQGFGMAALTAVCGPLVEIGLINFVHLYHYSHPEVLGVPTWIPWVYFCGGPAVGNLGRRIWQELIAE